MRPIEVLHSEIVVVIIVMIMIFCRETRPLKPCRSPFLLTCVVRMISGEGL